MKQSIKRGLAAGLAIGCLASAALPSAADGLEEVSVPPEVTETGESVWLYEREAGESVADLILAAGAEAWNETAAVPAEASDLKVGGKGAVLIDLDSGRVLFEQDSHTRVPIASVTKVMTLLLIFEAMDEGRVTEETTVTCSAEAASMGGSQIWLKEGEIMSVCDLLKAIAVVSANDACAAMAEHLDGSVAAFVARMNRRAAELGMQDTQFLDCCGLDDTAYSSAYDVALMSRELMRHPQIQKYTTIWMDTLRGGASQLVNTNKLVRFYKGATGLKTGTTAAAGHCLAATAERSGLRLCAVTLGCATTDERFGGARAMLDFGFANYAVYTPSVDPEQLPPLRVLHGEQTEVHVSARPMETLLVKKGQEQQVRCEVRMAEDVEAPVYAGETLGEVAVCLGEETLASYPLLAAEDIPRLSIGTALRRLWAALVW